MREFTFEDYCEAIESQKSALLREKDDAIREGVLLGEDVATLRAERIAIQSAGVDAVDGDREHLIAQWPTVAGFVLPAPLRG